MGPDAPRAHVMTESSESRVCCTYLLYGAVTPGVVFGSYVPTPRPYSLLRSIRGLYRVKGHMQLRLTIRYSRTRTPRIEGDCCVSELATAPVRLRVTRCRWRRMAWHGAATRVSIRRARPPLSTNNGFGRGAHAWRRCSWAMSSDISLSTSSRGFRPGWLLIIAAILLLLRPLSTSDSAQSASAVISMRMMAAIRKQLSAISTVKNAADLHHREAPSCFAGRSSSHRTHLNLSWSSSNRLQDSKKPNVSEVHLPVPRDFLCLAESYTA